MKYILLEIWFFAQLPLTWWFFRRFARRNVSGEMIAGSMIGLFNEFATEPLWDYHFRINFYKDAPVGIVLGWGVMFALVVFASEKLYCAFLRKDRIEPHDKRIFIFDMLAGALIAFPVETLCLKIGAWDYHWELLRWDWGRVPFFNMPYEALAGYMLLMLVGPTFVRYWETTFDSILVPGARK